MEIASLDEEDARRITARVAGPAALLVAKAFKLSERIENPDRLEPKDAHDVYRLLRSVPTEDLPDLADSFVRLLGSEVAGDVTRRGVGYLEELFGTADDLGSQLAGRAEEGVGSPDVVSQAVAVLVGDLLGELNLRGAP